jgi:hypothetical protein
MPQHFAEQILARIPETAGLYHRLQEVLSGLSKVVLKLDDLRAALVEGGMPATPADIKKRVEEFLASLTAGKDPTRVRIVLE